MDEPTVRIREVPEQVLVIERRTVEQAELEKWLPGAMARVAELAGPIGGVAGTGEAPWLDRAGQPDAGVFVVIYEGNPNEGPTEVVCAAVLRPGSDVPAGVDSRTVPAHREAYVRVTKQTVTSGRLGAVYPAIGAWIAGQGHTITAAPREVYWTDFHGAADGDEVFDVAFPFG